MVIALFVVAFAMVVGGLSSVWQGSGFVVLDLGWTMVISGTVAATGGVLLGALALAIGHLRRVEANLQRTLERLGRSGDLTAAPMPPSFEATSALPEAGVGAIGAAAVASALARQDPAETEDRVGSPAPREDVTRDDFVLAELHRDEAEPPTGGTVPEDREVAPPRDVMTVRGAAARPDEPGPLREAPPRETPSYGRFTLRPPAAPREEVASSAGPERSFGTGSSRSDDDSLFVERRSEADRGAASEPPPAGDATRSVEDVAAAAPAPPSVVGTYHSGGNSYVMYSDGAIEAETPTGRYHFASLDQLKEFIASGGEDPSGSVPSGRI